MKAAVALMVGTAMLATAVWLHNYGHYVGPSRSIYRDRVVGFVQPAWADPAAVATAILGGTLVLLAVIRLARRASG